MEDGSVSKRSVEARTSLWQMSVSKMQVHSTAQRGLVVRARELSRPVQGPVKRKHVEIRVTGGGRRVREIKWVAVGWHCIDGCGTIVNPDNPAEPKICSVCKKKRAEEKQVAAQKPSGRRKTRRFQFRKAE